MKTIPIYQVDAFADRLFEGNPAAVCPLDNWLDTNLMQKIARENNLSETAFIVSDRDRGQAHIRWFTPMVEVDLCGHATLAAAHVMFNILKHPSNEINFRSRSGPLKVSKNAELITLDFPADEVKEIPVPPLLLESLGLPTTPVYQGSTDIMVVVDQEAVVRSLAPDFQQLSRVEARGVIVTAPGEEVDFVSRFFAPGSGIDEDPVTGSAHCTLTPYWSDSLGKKSLTAVQLSSRGGKLQCELCGERVKISGGAVTYLQGSINI